MTRPRISPPASSSPRRERGVSLILTPRKASEPAPIEETHSLLRRRPARQVGEEVADLLVAELAEQAVGHQRDGQGLERFDLVAVDQGRLVVHGPQGYGPRVL